MTTKDQPKPLLTKSWATVHGEATAELWSKTGTSGILRLALPGTRTPEAKYRVSTRDAVEAFRTACSPDFDFDGESGFGDWILYVFTSRNDVSLMI